MQKLKFPLDEFGFNKWLVKQYFEFGSVDEVFKHYNFSIPISYAQYQRVLDKWQIVKTAGPNSRLSEALDFLANLGKENIAFEDLYKKLPSGFQTSASTLYRILGYVKQGITRRVGVCLVLSPYNDKKMVLIARDISTPRIQLGKEYGFYSLPMGYAKKRNSRKVNIKRILQQEVFTQKTIQKSFPDGLLEIDFEPFMYLDIADVRVAVYQISLPKSLSSASVFSSSKLVDYRFETIDNILSGKPKALRAGIKEAVYGYKKYLKLLGRNLTVNPLQEKSLLNNRLATVKVELEI
jgi:hypothetical protein